MFGRAAWARVTSAPFDYVLSRVLRVPRPRNHVVVIPPSDIAGSVGDDAMLSVLLRFISDELGSRGTILTGTASGWELLFGGQADFAQANAQGFRGFLVRRQILLSARAAVFVGADVIDGSYDSVAVTRALHFMEVAGRGRANLVVTGCSVSSSFNHEIAALLRRMRNLTIFARDPVSMRRLIQASERDIVLAADLAFLLVPAVVTEAGRLAEAWLTEQFDAGRKTLMVNVSGHTLPSMLAEGVSAITETLGGWLEADATRAVIVVPHDFRPPPYGDVSACSSLFEVLLTQSPGRVFMSGTLRASEVKQLMRSVDLVFTGRMHLAIAALGAGVPALCVVYRGKFEGLMEHFVLDGLLVEPGDVGDSDRMSEKLEKTWDRRFVLRGRISQRLPEIHRLARRNLSFGEVD